ncbi:MAG: flippase [Actinobacteria bacterium]|nr:flippase [Actinomycetota bacterium]
MEREKDGKFIQGTAITFISGILSFLLGIPASVILARMLGPEGRGIYALAMLLPTMIVTLGNLGIGPATVFYIARGDFRRQEIFGNDALLSLFIGGSGVLVGLVVVFFFRQAVFPGVSLNYLLIALTLVPLELFFSYVNCILLGAQRIKEYNYVQIIQSVLFLAFIAFALLGAKGDVTGAVLAGIFSWLIVNIIVFILAKRIADGIILKPNKTYIKKAAAYGAQAHLANILGFLNYRIDMFMVNIFLDPAAVGLYAIAVGLIEKIWMVSHSASTVLFPRIAAEREEERQKDFTPLVARTVLWTTAIGALVLALLSRWIILFLFSEAFLPAVGALRALIIGVIMLSAGRVLANDLAGRGFPRLNIYTGLAAVVTNVALNSIWIPRYGIVGAAWASTASYSVTFLLALFFYCRISGNRWTKVILPQPGDLSLYYGIANRSIRWMRKKLRRG